MTPETSTDPQEDEIKYLLLAENEEERLRAADSLFLLYGVDLMRSIQHHHPGLNGDEHHDILVDAIERFSEIFPVETGMIDRPIKPRLLRTAYFVGREHYRKISGRREREVGEMIDDVAKSLKDSEFGSTWHEVADESFRNRVGEEIRKVAAQLKPRQRQIALFFAETWGMEFAEREAITEIFRTSGQRLTRDQYKRALDEVRGKLREPIRKLIIEEGYGY